MALIQTHNSHQQRTLNWGGWWEAEVLALHPTGGEGITILLQNSPNGGCMGLEAEPRVQIPTLLHSSCITVNAIELV